MDLLNIDNAYGVGDIDRTYLYVVSLSDLPASVEIPEEMSVANIDLYNLDSDFPDSKVRSAKVPWAGRFYWSESVDDSSGVTRMSWRLDEKGRMWNLLKELRRLTGDQKANAKAPWAERSFTLTLAQVSVDKSTVLRKAVLKNCKLVSLTRDRYNKQETGTGEAKAQTEIHWNEVEYGSV